MTRSPLHRITDDRLRLLSRWIAVAIVGSILLLALGLRLYQLDHEPLHVDELSQVQRMQAPLGELIELSYRQQQPPLDYLIGKAVVTIAAATDFSQRLPAAIFGAGAVVLLALVLVRFGMPIAALTAGILGAIHPLLVQYSQYARPYALPLFFVVLTIAVYQHWRLGSRRWWTLLAFAVVASLAMVSRATMPMLALAFLGLIGVVQAFRAQGFNIRRIITFDPLATVVLPATFLIVWVPSFLMLRRYGSGFLSSGSYDLWGRLSTAVERIGDFGEQALRPTSLLLLLVVLGLIAMLPPVHRALGSTLYLWIPLLVTAPAFAVVHSLVTKEGQFFATRYMVFLPLGIAAYVGIATEGIVLNAWSRDRWLGVGAGSAAALVLAVTLFVPMGRLTQSKLADIGTSEWDSVGRYIESIEEPGDVIIAIDTRTFRHGAFNFGFMSAPRYYSGETPYLRPDDVIVNADDPAQDARRYHFVLFVPRLAPNAELPADWQEQAYFGMIVITTPPLAGDAEREQAWWILVEYLRADVSVMTRIAGLALSERWFGTVQPYQWQQSILDEAERLDLIDLAEQWLERIAAP